MHMESVSHGISKVRVLLSCNLPPQERMRGLGRQASRQPPGGLARGTVCMCLSSPFADLAFASLGVVILPSEAPPHPVAAERQQEAAKGAEACPPLSCMWSQSI